MRKYTSISSVETKGEVLFYIRIYRDSAALITKEGLFTSHLEKNINEGDFIKCDAPLGKLKYRGFGIFQYYDKNIRGIKRIGMIAGGTGITPLFSMIQASSMANDGVEIILIISNKTKNDIILKTELDSFMAINKRLKVHYTLTRHNQKTHGVRAGQKGRIDYEMLETLEFPLN